MLAIGLAFCCYLLPSYQLPGCHRLSVMSSVLDGALDLGLTSELQADDAPAEEQEMEEDAESGESSATSRKQRSGKGGQRRTSTGSSATSVKGKGRGLESKKVQGVKKQSKTHSRRCKGCGLWFRADDMGSRSPYCVKDKTRVDNLTRLAKQLGRSAWFAAIKADESKLPHALRTYRELTGDDGEGAKKKAGPESSVLFVVG